MFAPGKLPNLPLWSKLFDNYGLNLAPEPFQPKDSRVDDRLLMNPGCLGQEQVSKEDIKVRPFNPIH